MEALSEELLRTKLQEGAIKIFEKGLVQAGEGNISVRIPNKDELLITPTYNKYYNLKKKDLVHIKFDGTILKKGQKPSTEYLLHIALYKARPKVNCVIHTHSPYATVMSVARKPIPIILEEQVTFLGGSINISEFNVAHSEKFNINAVKAMDSKNGVLLANHGTLACGKSIEDAIKVSELIEKLAFIYIGAERLGKVYEISESSCSRFYKEFEKNFSTHTELNGKCD
ncbi:MAG: class II aldolase/adducin family protein [Promethearchaeota archaeon]